jgi:hypothetical protein
MYPRPTCPIQLVRQAAPTGKILDAPTHCTWCNSALNDRTYLAAQLFAQYSISWPTWANWWKCIPVAGRYSFLPFFQAYSGLTGYRQTGVGVPLASASDARATTIPVRPMLALT